MPGRTIWRWGTRVGIDATRKRADEGYHRDWPPEIRMDEETRARVTARWAEYGIGDLARIGVANEWSGQGAGGVWRDCSPLRRRRPMTRRRGPSA